MAKDVKYSNQFLKDMKDYKNDKKFKKATPLFDECIKLLANGQKLPEIVKDHLLVKSTPGFTGYREFHISPDICVIYKYDATTLYIYRIGSHTNLFRKM